MRGHHVHRKGDLGNSFSGLVSGFLGIFYRLPNIGMGLFILIMGGNSTGPAASGFPIPFIVFHLKFIIVEPQPMNPFSIGDRSGNVPLAAAFTHTNEKFNFTDLFLQILNIANRGDSGGVYFQIHLIGVANRGDKLDIGPGNRDPVIGRHITVPGQFHTGGIQDFPIIGITGIQAQNPHVIAHSQLHVAEGGFHLDCHFICPGLAGNFRFLHDPVQAVQAFQFFHLIFRIRSGNLGEVNVRGRARKHFGDQGLALFGHYQLRKFSQLCSVLSFIIYPNEIRRSNTGPNGTGPVYREMFIEVIGNHHRCAVHSSAALTG